MKQAIKELRAGTWNVENCQKLEECFTGDEQVSKRIGFNFYACQDSVMRIEGKCRSVNIEACKKMSFYIDACISEIYIMNCSNIKVFLQKDIKSCSIESSKEITVHLTNKTRNCNVATTCTRSVVVRFPLTGTTDDCADEAGFLKVPVPETFENRVVGDELVTKQMEQVE